MPPSSISCPCAATRRPYAAASLRKPLKNKRETLLRRHDWYPHNAIAQGTVIAGEPLVEKTCSSVIFGSQGRSELNRESVEDEYGSIAMVQASQQNLIRVQPKDSAKSEGIWKGAIEKGDVNRS